MDHMHARLSLCTHLLQASTKNKKKSFQTLAMRIDRNFCWYYFLRLGNRFFFQSAYIYSSLPYKIVVRTLWIRTKLNCSHRYYIMLTHWLVGCLADIVHSLSVIHMAKLSHQNFGTIPNALHYTFILYCDSGIFWQCAILNQNEIRKEISSRDALQLPTPIYVSINFN